MSLKTKITNTAKKWPIFATSVLVVVAAIMVIANRPYVPEPTPEPGREAAPLSFDPRLEDITIRIMRISGHGDDALIHYVVINDTRYYIRDMSSYSVRKEYFDGQVWRVHPVLIHFPTTSEGIPPHLPFSFWQVRFNPAAMQFEGEPILAPFVSGRLYRIRWTFGRDRVGHRIFQWYERIRHDVIAEFYWP